MIILMMGKNAALINVASELVEQLCLILTAIQTKFQRDRPSLILVNPLRVTNFS